MSMTPDEVRSAFDALSDEDKLATGLLVSKQNKSWESNRSAVKAHLLKHGTIYLAHARELDLVPSDTKSRVFVKCVIEPLIKSGMVIEEQRGILPRGAVIYHLPGEASPITPTKKTVFATPTKDAAVYIVNEYINGFSGNINVRKSLTEKQFPFLSDKKSARTLNRLIIDNLPKGCGATSRLFVYVKEDRK